MCLLLFFLVFSMVMLWLKCSLGLVLSERLLSCLVVVLLRLMLLMSMLFLCIVRGLVGSVVLVVNL